MVFVWRDVAESGSACTDSVNHSRTHCFLHTESVWKPPKNKSPFRWRVSVHRQRHFQPAPGAPRGADPGTCEAGEGRGGLTAAGWSSRPRAIWLIQGETQFIDTQQDSSKPLPWNPCCQHTLIINWHRYNYSIYPVTCRFSLVVSNQVHFLPEPNQTVTKKTKRAKLT